MPRFGVETTLINGTDLAAWQAAVRPNTKVFFLESPTNPAMEVCDLVAAVKAARRNVLVSGFDDIPAASLAQPPLTTIRQDYARAGELLVDMLIRRINRRETAPALLPPELVVRKSS